MSAFRKTTFEKIIEVCLVSLLVPMVLAFVALGLTIAVEAVQSVRAHDAEVACLARRGVPLRKPLSTQISCVPSLHGTRSDTLTVRGS